MTNAKANKILDIIFKVVTKSPKGGTWQEIMDAVSAKYKIKDWMEVRGLIQWMKDEKIIVKTKDVYTETYVLKGLK
jgi:hypothetical protein